jgi:hypothetical protein
MLSSIIFTLAVGGNLALAATSSSATKPPFSTIQPALTDIRAAQATVVPASPTSNVKGKAFDRIIHIWLENTVGQVCLIIRDQFLTQALRTLTRLLRTQTCNG